MKTKRKIISLLLSVAMLLTLVAIPATSFAGEHDETDIAYEVTGGNIYFDENTGTIVDCDLEVTAAQIPKDINGKAVKKIGKYAFYDCDILKKGLFQAV